MFLPALPFSLSRRLRVAFFVAFAATAGNARAQAQTQVQGQAGRDEPAAPAAQTPRDAPDAPPGDQNPVIVNNGPATSPNNLSPYAVTPLAGANAGRPSAEMHHVLMEGRIRDLMRRLGIVSLSTQDAILSFMNADEEGRRQVREAGRKLLSGVRRDAPPERLKALLSDYQGAIDANRERRERAQTALDAQVGYSLDAHLESLLWLLGVLGQGQNAFGPGAFGMREDVAGRSPIVARAATLEVQSKEIEGTITAKSGADEPVVWLEIRDEGGRLWRLKPDAAPGARDILNRQISGLSLGSRIVARVGTPVPIPVLLAIIPQNTDPDPLNTP